jgi:hypothetical protein
MRKITLSEMTTEELILKFAEIGVAQDDALLHDQVAKFNRFFDSKTAVTAELSGRPGDQRRALLKLFDHPNLQVQLNAAKATLAIDPVAARRKLEEISEKKWAPQGLDAGMSLWNLDRGVFKPT